MNLLHETILVYCTLFPPPSNRTNQAAGKNKQVIPKNCKTRWNSCYNQAKVILNNKFCIQQLLDILRDENKLAVEYDDADWANTNGLVNVLKLFSETTDVLQGDEFITSSMVAMLVSELHTFCVLKACDMDLPQNIRDAADLMFNDVQDRFYPATNCAQIAALCDPRVKKLTWCDATEKKKFKSLTVDAMVTIMTEDASNKEAGAAAAGAGGGTTAGGATGDSQQAQPPVHPDLRKKKPVNKSSLLFAKMLAASSLGADDDEDPELPPQSPEAILAERKRSAEYELGRYMQAAVLPSTASSGEVLDWWFSMRLVYPTLYKTACIYLAVPASSGSSERVFSTAGNVVTKKRNRLGEEAVHNLVFLHGCHGVGWKMGDANPRRAKKAKTSK